MRLSFPERLLLYVGIVCCPLLLFNLVKQVRNRVFARRIEVLEELLDSKLRCTFSIVSPTVEICGRYKGRPIKFSSYLSGLLGLFRIGEFMLPSSKISKQKTLPLQYPMVSENVHQVGGTLVYSNCDDFLLQPTVLEKARALQILDELVNTAVKYERADNQEQC